MPSPEEIAKHETAAGFVIELRRRGVPCHVQKRSTSHGEYVDVIIDPDRCATENFWQAPTNGN
jgi:hypothetical protein